MYMMSQVRVAQQPRTKIKVPKSAKPILYLLNEHGVLTQKEILQLLNLPPKTARYALKRLKEEGIIQSIPDLMDMRSQKYRISTEKIDYETIQRLIKDAVDYTLKHKNEVFKNPSAIN